MSSHPASFRKADLQVHTPRDANWSGKRPESEEERQEWADEFIDACIAKDLQVVSLTDHHEGVLCWSVIERLEERSKIGENIDLWVLPGMELTCRDSVQALLIFDGDIEKGIFEKARGILGLVYNCNVDAPKGIDVVLIDQDINNIQDLLEKDAELTNKFIIMPNVTPNGHKTIVRKGFHTRFRDMPYVGGYLDGRYPKDLNAKDLAKLKGEVPAWSSEPKGVVATSDSRDRQYSKLGEFATWIKLAAPTAESLRQAMLAADSRLRYEPPAPPPVYIESVKVEGASFLDLGSELCLSPQYNALIGGRGAGKSTLLEYIRYALGRSAIEETGTKYVDPTTIRRRNLLERTLDSAHGSVSLILNMDGASVEIKRSRSSEDHIEYKVNGESRFVSPDDLTGFVQIQSFSQGELSLLGEHEADKPLLELITSPRKSDFGRVDSKANEIIDNISSSLDVVARGWHAEREQRRSKVEHDTIKARIQSIRESISSSSGAASAVVEEHQAILDTDRWIVEARKLFVQSSMAVQTAINQSISSLELLTRSESVPADATAQEVAKVAIESIVAYRELLRHSGRIRTETTLPMEHLDVEWAKTRDDHNISYQKAIEARAGHARAAQDIAALEARRAELADSISRLQASVNQGLSARESLDKLSSDLIAEQISRAALTLEVAREVQYLSSGLATASLHLIGDSSDVEAKVYIVFDGTEVRENRKEDLINHIMNSSEPMETWWSFVTELMEILRWNQTGLRETYQRPSLSIIDQFADSGGVDRLCEKLTVDKVREATKVQIRPRLDVKQLKGSIEFPFVQSSQGERATILLAILMKQQGGPLIIDQPEEDLDNKIIGDIVKSIRDSKNNRQIIFATHNANLVVNGDAELVTDLEDGKIRASGAIDVNDVRDAITSTMEGGRDAFELRRIKYNF